MHREGMSIHFPVHEAEQDPQSRTTEWRRGQKKAYPGWGAPTTGNSLDVLRVYLSYCFVVVRRHHDQSNL